MPYTISERYNNGYKNAERLFSFQERLFQFVIYFIRHWFQSLVAMVLLHILVVGEMLEPGKFNIEVQSVDRCNLNNLYLKTPRGQGARSPHKRLCMAEEISNA